MSESDAPKSRVGTYVGLTVLLAVGLFVLLFGIMLKLRPKRRPQSLSLTQGPPDCPLLKTTWRPSRPRPSRSRRSP